MDFIRNSTLLIFWVSGGPEKSCRRWLLLPKQKTTLFLYFKSQIFLKINVMLDISLVFFWELTSFHVYLFDSKIVLIIKSKCEVQETFVYLPCKCVDRIRCIAEIHNEISKSSWEKNKKSNFERQHLAFFILWTAYYFFGLQVMTFIKTYSTSVCSLMRVSIKALSSADLDIFTGTIQYISKCLYNFWNVSFSQVDQTALLSWTLYLMPQDTKMFFYTA